MGEVDNSSLFLDYMHANGFNSNKYKYVLELLQSASESISKYLDISQYLLSRRVNYQELKNYRIDGAFGYLNQNGIYIPKTVENDEHFLSNEVKIPYLKYHYSYPSIDAFDVIVCCDEWITRSKIRELINILRFNQDKYLGFVADKDDQDLYHKVLNCQILLEGLNAFSDVNYEIIHDTVSEKNKELFLIKKENKYTN